MDKAKIQRRTNSTEKNGVPIKQTVLRNTPEGKRIRQTIYQIVKAKFRLNKKNKNRLILQELSTKIHSMLFAKYQSLFSSSHRGK